MTAPQPGTLTTESLGHTPTAGRIRQAETLLARSFEDQPHFTDMLPDSRVRARALPHVFAALLGDALRHGRIDVTTRDGQLAGVAAWYPPWRYPLTAGRQMAALPHTARLTVVARRSLRRVLQFQSTAAKLHPGQPYWYLAAVGVDPAAQGAGIGTRLIEHGLTVADAASGACYLETHTPRLVAWYQRLGFAVRREAVAFTSGGPPSWTMLRPPRR